MAVPRGLSAILAAVFGPRVRNTDISSRTERNILYDLSRLMGSKELARIWILDLQSTLSRLTLSFLNEERDPGRALEGANKYYHCILSALKDLTFQLPMKGTCALHTKEVRREGVRLMKLYERIYSIIEKRTLSEDHAEEMYLHFLSHVLGSGRWKYLAAGIMAGTLTAVVAMGAVSSQKAGGADADLAESFGFTLTMTAAERGRHYRQGTKVYHPDKKRFGQDVWNKFVKAYERFGGDGRKT
jgi:hypothetical protein